MYCVIVGGGMVGEYLARTLLAEGDQVALIEGDPSSCHAPFRNARRSRARYSRRWV